MPAEERTPLRQYDEDTEEEDGGSAQLKVLVPFLFVGGILAIILGVVASKYMNSGKAAPKEACPTEKCPGFEECPPYPAPYEDRVFPVEPTLVGAFPSDFIWGLGTASYQIEGAYKEDGRGASIWDTFTGANTVGMPGANCSYCCQQAPCKPNDSMKAKGATGNIACDHWHTWRDDIALMKSMNLKHYRFSIAWPRVIPTGFFADGVNDKALQWYSDFIDALELNGIEPAITLYHWDLPQGLLDPGSGKAGWYSVNETTDKPDGWILPEWNNYVRLCFQRFGNRVKTWITFNEAWTFTFLASGWGKAPAIPEYSDKDNKWPWVAGHNILLAHANAVDIYRKEFGAQGGKIGITNNCDWREPATAEPEDVAAAERAVLFWLGWFADPIYGKTGDYPEPMKKLYGEDLPEFTEDQKKMLNGSADFFGLNHYGTGFATYKCEEAGADRSYADITHADLPKAESAWLFGAGWGLRKLLNWVKNRYDNPDVYLTEGGWSLEANAPEKGAKDPDRVGYYANYTSEVLKAIKEDGCNVKSYFAWSLMDNFEWEMGYQERFGVTYTDYKLGPDPNAPTAFVNANMQPTEGNQVRRRKDSSCWLEAVWTGKKLVDVKPPYFSGCVNSSVFSGTFTDLTLGACEPEISVNEDGLTGNVTCGGIGCLAEHPCYGTHDITFSGSTIIVPFQAGGVGASSKTTGYWNRKGMINWGSGGEWKKKLSDTPTTETVV